MSAKPTATDNVIRERIDGVARRLRHLAPDYNNPERYYRRRDDLVDELVSMSRRG